MGNNALDEFVVVASHDGRIQALDARDGRARWTQTRGHPFAGLALAQVGHEVVAVSLDGYVCVLSLDDGMVRWERSLPIAGPVPTPTYGLRIAANQQLVAVQLSSSIFALAPDDGHTSWEARPAPATRQWWLLAAGEGHIYTLQKEVGQLPDAPHQGLEAPQQRQPSEPLNPYAPPPTFFITTAFSALDGTPQWFAHEEHSAVGPPWDGGSSLVEADGMVYIYGRQGLHAFEAESGTRLWTCDTVPYYHVGALTLGRDAIAVAAGGHIGVYRRDTGALLWSKTVAIRADGYFRWFSTPLVFGDAVCVGSSMSGPLGFQLEAYVGETGAPGWVWPGHAAAASTAVPVEVSWRYRGAGTTLYVPSRDVLWAINAVDGSERWHLSYDFRSGFNALLAVAMANP